MNEVRAESGGYLRVECSRHRKQQIHGPWGRNVLGVLEKRQEAAVAWVGGPREEGAAMGRVSKVAGLANNVVRTLDFTLGRGKPSEG